MATTDYKKSDFEDVTVHPDGSASETSHDDQVLEVDEAYLRASKTTKIWRSVAFQMVLFGA